MNLIDRGFLKEDIDMYTKIGYIKIEKARKSLIRMKDIFRRI